MRLGVAGVAAGASIILAACSPPSFQKPTADLSKGLSEAKAAFETLAEDERQAFIATKVREGLRPGSVILAKGCSQIVSTLPADPPPPKYDCRPVLANGSTREPIDFNPAVPKLLHYMEVLDNYGKGLADLAAADDVTALKAASSKAIGGVGALATAFGGPAGAAAAAALGVVDLGVGFLLDQQRLHQLQKVIKAADVSIEVGLGVIIEAAVQAQQSVAEKRSNDLNLMARALQTRSTGTDPITAQATGEALVAGHYSLQAYVNTDVREAFVKMRQAHGKLLEAVEHPQYDPAAALNSINDFVDKMSALRTAFTKLGSNK